MTTRPAGRRRPRASTRRTSCGSGEEKRSRAPSNGHKPRRWVVERTLAWLCKCRGILVRYDKKDKNYLGLIQLACALCWYRRLYRLGLVRLQTICPHEYPERFRIVSKLWGWQEKGMVLLAVFREFAVQPGQPVVTTPVSALVQTENLQPRADPRAHARRHEALLGKQTIVNGTPSAVGT